ncbi:hypothetical protein RJ639_032654, partial [Escallonia herrerae]
TAFVADDHKENQCKPPGTASLPRGILSKTSNLERRPLWGSPKKNVDTSKNLLSLAVGIKQKEMVDKMVKKFLSCGFVVMLFHYDDIVDEWKQFEWSNSVIHVSAVNQTKWWFAKRFLHPDIVAEYSYIFIWDEDLGVENFNPDRYLSIVKDEGLEISQPALDSRKSEVHHQITARGRRSNVHRLFCNVVTWLSVTFGAQVVIAFGRPILVAGERTSLEIVEVDVTRTVKLLHAPGRTMESKENKLRCRWIEVMAPVFSKAAWHCVWYMIQNDLIHAWGLDMQLGYCAQAISHSAITLSLSLTHTHTASFGDRTKNIGVVDAEYIVHHGLPTLGEPENKASSTSRAVNYRVEVRRQSYNEYKEFKRRWMKAAQEDECWIDPYPEPVKWLS